MVDALVEQVRGPLGFRDAVLCGRGATSRVYKAVDAKTGGLVALKRLHRHLVRDQNALARLKRELEALRALSHPGIVTVHDVIHWEGDPTLVMEFIEGEDLKERITRQGKLDAVQTEDVARQLLDILATTHAAGIVHRDVKPHNMRMDSTGRLRLLDFGSARLDAASALTSTGTTVGTPEYMPPELFVGGVYDPRADLYGAGATLFECLTGHPPHMADSQAHLAFLKASQDAPRVRDVRPDTPAHLAQLVDRCLSRAPEERHATASLAVWALNHPEAERAFLARRSNNPLCLHCHTAIPPRSGICPACKHATPFKYEPGPCHVELRSVQEPSRFMEYVVLHAPSRGQAAQLMALSQDVAALAHGPVRYVSFLSETEANRVVGELAQIGVGAQVVRPVTMSPPGIMALLGGSMAMALTTDTGLGDVAALGAGIVVLERAMGLLDAREGILAASGKVRRHWYRLKHVLLGTVAASGAALAAGLGGMLDGRSFAGATALAGVSAVMALVAGRVMDVQKAPLRALPSPEPSLPVKLKEGLLGRARRVKTVDQMRAASALTALVLSLSAVPLELNILVDLRNRVNTWRGTVETSPWDPPPPPPTAPPAGTPNTPAPTPPPPPAPVAAVTIKRVVGLGAGASPLVAAAGAVFWMRRRRRLLLEAGAQVFQELDLPTFKALSRRTSPAPGTNRRVGESRLAALNLPDAFARQALMRAVDMAPYLTADTLQRLTASLETLAGRPGAAADASLLARCILETDADQASRFRFLELEGELEAQAAAEWFKRKGEP